MSESSWVRYGDENFDLGEVRFVPMMDGDRASLLAELLLEEDKGGSDERMEATHFGIQVMYPKPEDADTQEERDELTWHDFCAMPAKQVNGEWYVWIEDVTSTGVVWFQSTYTRVQVEAVRDVAIKLASEGRLYNDMHEEAKSVMTFW